ncbi:MAG: hypothetical protein ACRC67_04665 [Inquilinus sp.]|uniref:hypothetical protein n=1 Tax=Inquilinus sp. TaxID=1932117 RepID=UPI003F345817
MAISDAELDVLVKITGTFETSGDPYIGVSGDFDLQGISCGVLQWNIGQNSLQPLVKAVGKAAVVAAMPTLGAAMWDACNGPIPAALATVRSWQNGSALKTVPKRELQSLMGSEKMRAEQNTAIRKTGQKAEALADGWARDRGTGRRTAHELAWFFDVVTQNGSMKDLTFQDVTSFKNAAGDGKADDLVCDWLAGTDSRFAGMVDCHKNATLWRDGAIGVALDLLVLGYLRSQKSTLRWRGDVLNRKGTLATKGGWVHRQQFDLSGIL